MWLQPGWTGEACWSQSLMKPEERQVLGLCTVEDEPMPIQDLHWSRCDHMYDCWLLWLGYVTRPTICKDGCVPTHGGLPSSSDSGYPKTSRLMKATFALHFFTYPWIAFLWLLQDHFWEFFLCPINFILLLLNDSMITGLLEHTLGANTCCLGRCCKEGLCLFIPLASPSVRMRVWIV